MTPIEIRCLRDDWLRFHGDHLPDMDEADRAVSRDVLRLLARYGRWTQANGPCEACGGEGVIDGLVIGDSIRTEPCRRCKGTGITKGTLP